jgi:hypothetical protein
VNAIRRAHQRVPCDQPVAVHRGVALGRKLGDGLLLDLSLSGAYLLTTLVLERNTSYRLHAASAEGPVDLPFRLQREGPRTHPKHPGGRHYGILFNLTGGQEHVLRRWVDFLRRHPPTVEDTPFDRSMKTYWDL